jgi:oxygen-independent coproporphyrinogen III oxidase
MTEGAAGLSLQRAKWVAREISWTGDLPYPPTPVWGEINGADMLRAWRAALAGVSVAPDGSLVPAGAMLGCYVHIPFCLSRCAYCTMRSVVEKSPYVYDAYLGDLDTELRLLAGACRFSPRSLYVGGGTPTILSEAQLARFCDILHSRLDLSGAVQKLMEISPLTASPAKLKVLARYGFTDVSIGVQSGDVRLLAALNRRQTRAGVLRTYEAARRCGIRHVNMDLMAGLPGQDMASFLKGLAWVAGLRPNTITIHPYHPDKVSDLRSGGAGFLRLRSEMEAAGRLFLDRWFPSAAKRRAGYEDIAQILDKKNLNAPLLGVGYGAIGHIPGHFHYGKAGSLAEYGSALRGGRLPPFGGARLSRDTEMRGYVIANLESEGYVDKARFRKLFGSDFDSVLGAARRRVLATGMIRDGEDFFAFRDVSRRARNVLTKFFYAPEVFRRIYLLARRRGALTGSIDSDLTYIFTDELMRARTPSGEAAYASEYPGRGRAGRRSFSGRP